VKGENAAICAVTEGIVSDQPQGEWQLPYPPQQPRGQQPPGWDPGQPPYQGQPYGIPGGVPPYPGYGYGPGPPWPGQSRRGHYILIAIGAGIAAVAVAIVVAVLVPASGTHNVSAGSTGGSGSYFDMQDLSGDTYQVTLDKIVDPGKPSGLFSNPGPGTRDVGVVFTIQAIKGSPQDENADLDATVVGSNGHTYSGGIDTDIVGYSNFDGGQINVAQGDSVTGVVVFSVPNGIRVKQVQWSGTAGLGAPATWSVNG